MKEQTKLQRAEWVKRGHQIVKDHDNGYSFNQLSRKYGTSAQNMQRLYEKYKAKVSEA